MPKNVMFESDAPRTMPFIWRNQCKEERERALTLFKAVIPVTVKADPNFFLLVFVHGGK